MWVPIDGMSALRLLPSFRADMPEIVRLLQEETIMPPSMGQCERRTPLFGADLVHSGGNAVDDMNGATKDTPCTLACAGGQRRGHARTSRLVASPNVQLRRARTPPPPPWQRAPKWAPNSVINAL